MEIFKSEALKNQNEFDRRINEKFISSDQIEMFKDLVVSSSNNYKNREPKPLKDTDDMDDWLDDLLN